MKYSYSFDLTPEVVQKMRETSGGEWDKMKQGGLKMPKKAFTPEEISSNLREAEVLLSQGQPLGTVCRGLGLSEQT